MKDYKKLQNGSDIRGIALDTDPKEAVNLTKKAAEDLGRAFALWLGKAADKDPEDLVIAIGRDSRISGPGLGLSLTRGIKSLGARVLGCGMASTPAMFMATVFPEIKADGSVMITASHLPSNRNGFKFFTPEGGLGKKEISQLISAAEVLEDLGEGEKGSSEACPLMELYAAHLRGIICKGLNASEEEKPLAGLHVAIDAGNGAGGFYVSSVLEPLGADCSGSCCLDPDGTFPNHQPNPENKAAMDSICAAVMAGKADLGIIFDTDVDRAAAVDGSGKPIDRNGIVALASVLAAEGHEGAVIVTDSITSSQLHGFLSDMGMEHLRYKRGYKNVIDKGIELNEQGKDCVLAIETSGHAAMRENYFLDDGAYLATRIVVKAAMLKKEGKTIGSCIEALEEPAEASEFRLGVRADDFAAYADSVLEALKADVEQGRAEGMELELPNYEGVRVTVKEPLGDGWFLIRKSLHDPLMPLNIESNEAGGLEKIKAAVLALLEKNELLDVSLLR